MDKQEKLALLNKVFSPSAPIKSKDLFQGRIQQLGDVTDAISEPGQHVVLYGERGVGKTSLANIMDISFQNVLSSKVTCNRRQNFKDVWEAALSKIRFEYSQSSIGFQAIEKKGIVQLNLFLPNNLQEISSQDVQNVLEKVNNYLLFIFDEFYSITDNETKVRFADTIKSLSDNAANVTILIVGIADSVNNLIGEHQSLERCIKQIRMPRMSDEELESIIAKGLEILDMKIDSNVTYKIVKLSLGFPHFTHLLAKYSAKTAIEEGKSQIVHEHFVKAINDCIMNVNQTVRDAYQKATITSKGESKFEDVIGSCSLAKTDEYETFTANDLIEPFFQIKGEKVKRESLTYYLSRLCSEERDNLLEKVGTSKNIRYRFKYPLIKYYDKTKVITERKTK
ncbi:MAG: ATP-binding protein [Nostoc sp.]|uniref:ATP-binding protein n=1 Tax=Nostoc sp. TaxID=1180 RepID=UPI002FF3E00A